MMIWIYSVKSKEFVAEDVTSITQLREIAKNKWVWLDIFNPDEKELEILSEIIGNKPKIVAKFKKIIGKHLDSHIEGCQLCDYEKIEKFIILTIPSITINKEVIVYPIFFARKRKMVITWGQEGETHSRIIKNTIRRLREGVEAEQELNSSIVISVMFHEIAIKNSEQILNIKEKIDELEERALESGEKNVVRSIFSFKKMISNLYRLMIEEKDFMLDVDKSVIPFIKLNEKSKPIVDEAIEIIDREIDFLDSYNRSLDSLLTLTDLASIHKVESSINYLTIILVIGTALLIFFELMAFLNQG